MYINSYFKLTIIIVLLSGCADKNPAEIAKHENAPEVEKLSPSPTSHLDGLEGYKELKFGMTSSELAKLPSCNESYIKYSDINYQTAKIDVVKDKAVIHPFQEKIAELTKHIAELQASNDRTQALIDGRREVLLGQLGTFENNKKSVLKYKQELMELELQAEYVRNHPDEFFQSEVQPLIDRLEQAKKYDRIFTDEWVASNRVFCMTEFMGAQKSVVPIFTQGVLSGVTMYLGAFDNDLYQSLINALAKKYAASYIPSESQISAYNAGKLRLIAYTFFDGQISLSADREMGGYKNMRLNYFDKATAQENLKKITQGLIMPSDI